MLMPVRTVPKPFPVGVVKQHLRRRPVARLYCASNLLFVDNLDALQFEQLFRVVADVRQFLAEHVGHLARTRTGVAQDGDDLGPQGMVQGLR